MAKMVYKNVLVAENDYVYVWRSNLNGNWYWTRFAGNNKILSASGEGYKNEKHAERMAKRCNSGVSVRIAK